MWTIYSSRTNVSLRIINFNTINTLTIVDSVLDHFIKDRKLEISNDEKVEIINNLLVTLSSDKEASPVLSVGSK